MTEESTELEKLYGAKVKRTKFGYCVKRKYGTINIYTSSEEKTAEDLPLKQVKRDEVAHFERFWKQLLERLGNPTLIKNWTVHSGYIGKDFLAKKHSESMIIECTLPTGRTLYIPKRDFEVIYNLWDDYKKFKIKRMVLCRLSRFTKYVISIIHQFEELMEERQMFEADEFVRWIDASHDLFEIFEGRYDAYPLCRKWVDEWFLKGEFTVEPSDRQRLINLINNLNFDVFGISDPKMRCRIV